MFDNYENYLCSQKCVDCLKKKIPPDQSDEDFKFVIKGLTGLEPPPLEGRNNNIIGDVYLVRNGYDEIS